MAEEPPKRQRVEEDTKRGHGGASNNEASAFPAAAAAAPQNTNDLILQEIRNLRKDFGVLRADVGALQQTVGTLQETVGTLQQDFGAMQSDVNTIKHMVTHEEKPQPHHTARLKAMMKQQVPSWEAKQPAFHAFCEALATPCESKDPSEECLEFEEHVAHVLARDAMAPLRRTILAAAGIRLPAATAASTAASSSRLNTGSAESSSASLEVACILPVLLEWITSLPPQAVQIQPQYLPPDTTSSVWVSDAVDDDHAFVFRAIAAYALAAIRFWWAQPGCKGVVVTGSPGIGKTWMGNYLLWWFLQQTEGTTIVYRSGKTQEVVLFDPSRRRKQMRLFNHVDPSLPLLSREQARQPNVIISDMYVKRAQKYIPSGRHGFEIVISSPNREEFHDFGTSDGRYVWIPELSASEVPHALRCMRRNPQPLSQHHMADLLAAFGGRPRPMLQQLRTTERGSPKRPGEGPLDGSQHSHADCSSSSSSTEEEKEEGSCSVSGRRESVSEADFAPSSYLDIEQREEAWLNDFRNDIRTRAILHHGNILALQHSLAARTASSDRSWSHKLIGYNPSVGLQRATIRWATHWVAWTTTQYIMKSGREHIKEMLASITDIAGAHGSLFGTVFEMAVHTLLQGEQQRCPYRRLLPQPAASSANAKGADAAFNLDAKEARETCWPTKSWRQWWVEVPSAAIHGDALLQHECTYLVPAASNFPVVDGLLCLDAPHLQAFLGVQNASNGGRRDSDGGGGRVEDGSNNEGGVVGVQITHAKQHAPAFDTFVNFALRHCMTAAGRCVLTDLLFVVPEAQFEAYKFQAIPIPADAARVPAAVLKALQCLRQWVMCVSFAGSGHEGKPQLQELPLKE